MELILFILGAGIGYLIRPAINFVEDYNYYSTNTTMSFERIVKRSLSKMWR